MNGVKQIVSGKIKGSEQNLRDNYNLGGSIVIQDLHMHPMLNEFCESLSEAMGALVQVLLFRC